MDERVNVKIVIEHAGPDWVIEKTGVAQQVTIDAQGNVVDKAGNVIGKAADLVKEIKTP